MEMLFLDRFFLKTLGLTKIHPYLPTFYGASFIFLLIHQILVPYVIAKWFRVAFEEKGRVAKNNWSIHVVSQVHASIVVPYALWCILNEKHEYSNDRVFGWNPEAGHLFAISSGYFVWDTLDTIINFIDAGFVIHGVACSVVYLMSFKPLVAYYFTRFLLWETSTIFLNNHWFLDKFGRTGTLIQAINGFFLLTSFFFLRLIYGGYLSYQLFKSFLRVYRDLPLVYIFVYGPGNIVLQSLNWFWFFKMVFALRRRFKGKTGEHSKLKSHSISNNGVIVHTQEICE